MAAPQPFAATAPVASLWQHTGVPAPARKPLAADARCDTVIVGAGFTGLALTVARFYT